MSTKNFFFAVKYFSIYSIYLRMIFIVLMFSACDDPPELNTNNKILFTSSRSGKEQLFMMNPDGSDIKQITFGEYSHNNGRWSPDAQKIVCNTDQNITTAGMQMVVMNVDGSNRKLLGVGSQMSWSPDGNRIGFMRWDSPELGNLTTYIYVIDKEGSNLFKLTNNFGVWDGTPNWAPDGSKIAFASSRNYSSPGTFSEIFIMNADGSSQTRLTFTDSITNANPVWSPDGSKIAYSSNGKLNLINSDGSSKKQLSNISTGGQIAWSYDGKYLGYGAGAINILCLADLSNKQIITDLSIWGCDWSK
ncbi:MAG: PD40 domain-containing protein [Ignavibacteriales bacterium]|mgnify:CR=1 FL=1|nr:PD40 domain-containing protein [Ignavibacteriales bacterium]